MKKLVIFLLLISSVFTVQGHWHTQLFDELADKMYCVSETTGSIESYDALLEEYCQRLIMELDQGADPNERDEDGMTPLMFAALFGYPSLVEELLKNPSVLEGIDLRNDYEYSALDYAEESPGLSVLFLQPYLLMDPFSCVPYITLLSYYGHKDPLNPYDQSAALLIAAGALPNEISLKLRVEKWFEEGLEYLSQQLLDVDEEEERQFIIWAREALQGNMEKLSGYDEETSFGDFCLQHTMELFDE